MASGDALFSVGLVFFGLIWLIWFGLSHEIALRRQEKRKRAMQFKILTREAFQVTLDGRLRQVYARQFLEHKKVISDWIEDLVKRNAKIEACIPVQDRLREFRPAIDYLTREVEGRVHVVMDNRRGTYVANMMKRN